MSGLDVENFNLFGKKPAPRPIQKPVATVMETAPIIEKTEAKPEINLIKEMNTSAQMTEMTPVSTPVEIERFEDTRLQINNSVNEVNFETNDRDLTRKTFKASSKVTVSDESNLRKFETFEKLTFRAPIEQALEMKKLEFVIMRSRKNGTNENRERITANSIMRALVSNFIERVGDMDLSNIENEDMLKERMEKIFKQKYNKKS